MHIGCFRVRDKVKCVGTNSTGIVAQPSGKDVSLDMLGGIRNCALVGSMRCEFSVAI